MKKDKKFWATWIIVLAILLILILTSIFYKPTPVNGNDTTSQPINTNIERTYLGKKIYQNTEHIYFYHGVINFAHKSSTYAVDCIVIGDLKFRQSAMGNIFIGVEKDMTFRLGDKTFKLIDYTRDWIELEEQ